MMKNKKKHRLLFCIIIAVCLITTTPVIAEYTRGDFWSRIDDTLVLTNTYENVSIGENSTTTHKLYINGTLFVNGTISALDTIATLGKLSAVGDVVAANGSFDGTLALGGAGYSERMGINVFATPLTGNEQYGINVYGACTENANFNAFGVDMTYQPSGAGKSFAGVNVPVTIAGTSDILSVKSISSNIWSDFDYTNTVSDINAIDIQTTWLGGIINNLRGYYYHPALYGGSWIKQCGIHITELDEATHNTHILLADTQPNGNWTIYSESDYPSYFDGNVTADNIFIPSYLFAHTSNNISVDSAGVWYNITFNISESLKQGITHNYNDNTNDTFTIIEDGIYDLHGHLSFEDMAVNPKSNICFRFTKNDVEIAGSLREMDLDKQDFDTLGSTSVLVSLVEGDEIKFQFTSDVITVTLNSDFTYGEHQDTAVLKINKISN